VKIAVVSAGQIPFLQQLAKDDADALLQLVRKRRAQRSEALLRSGAPGEEVVLVLSGRVRLVARGSEGREVVLALRGPGELIGEMAALGGGRRIATALAEEEVEAGFLSSAELRGFLRDRPDAAMVMIRMLVRRLAGATTDLVDLATHDSVARIARRLLELSSEHGAPAASGTRIRLSLSQEELASWTGTTRETVSRALRLMRQLRWVSTDHRSITVLDPEALRERSR
jgi:CRP/FNR family transcriptional regulator, cyclic AMP receptor protein